MVSLYHADLYGIRADGSGFRKITNAPDHNNSGNYIWKSEGTQISYRDGLCLIKTVPAKAGLDAQFKPLLGTKNGYDINTKQRTQVTDMNDGYARQFSISPSGKWIV